jgi:hypothetical protein
MARPTSFKPEYVEQAKKLAAILGAIDTEVAAFFEVTERTIARWKLAHPDFAKALSVGKDVANKRVEKSLYQRAIGFEHEAEEVFCAAGKVTRVKTVKKYPPDTGAIVFYLCNRDPANWRQRNQVDHTSSDGTMTPKGLGDFYASLPKPDPVASTDA